MDQDRRFPKALRKGFSNSIGCCGGGIGKNRNYGGACKKTFGESHGQKRRRKMKTRVVLALAALSHAPLLVAGDKAAYPKEKVAEFIVEKLDITSLPSPIRPKKEKGKKTFADYGLTPQRMDENEAIVEVVGGARRLSIKVLDQRPSGIYVCVAEPGQNAGEAKTQSVVLLKRNDSNALLKGHESWREFASCPVIGRSDKDSGASAY
jgi:hypothetical protein